MSECRSQNLSDVDDPSSKKLGTRWAPDFVIFQIWEPRPDCTSWICPARQELYQTLRRESAAPVLGSEVAPLT